MRNIILLFLLIISNFSFAQKVEIARVDPRTYYKVGFTSINEDWISAENAKKIDDKIKNIKNKTGIDIAFHYIHKEEIEKHNDDLGGYASHLVWIGTNQDNNEKYFILFFEGNSGEGRIYYGEKLKSSFKKHQKNWENLFLKKYKKKGLTEAMNAILTEIEKLKLQPIK